jgi:hypothetical protein
MNKEEIKKIGEYLNFKYVIARDVNSNDKLETQDRYIQQLYDAYLDLRIKYNDLQSQLDIANNKLDKIKEMCENKIDNFNEDIRDYLDDNLIGNEDKVNELREFRSWFIDILSIIGGNDE